LFKHEPIQRKIYNRREDSKRDVFDYIVMSYNLVRRHGYTNRLSPVGYEQQYFKRLAGI
jgi:putative transposase